MYIGVISFMIGTGIIHIVFSVNVVFSLYNHLESFKVIVIFSSTTQKLKK